MKRHKVSDGRHDPFWDLHASLERTRKMGKKRRGKPVVKTRIINLCVVELVAVGENKIPLPKSGPQRSVIVHVHCDHRDKEEAARKAAESLQKYIKGTVIVYAKSVKFESQVMQITYPEARK